MVVVDVETTGVNPQKHSLVSIGAVDLNDPQERLYVECRVWDGAHIDQESLDFNGFSEAEVKDSRKSSETEAVSNFFSWFEGREDMVFVAQNPMFDLGFLQAAAQRAHLNFRLAHRTIDLHTVAFFHMVKAGIEPPIKNKKSDINSDRIMEYVGIPAEPRPHRAINGAVWEAEALSRLLFNKNLLEEFKDFPIKWGRD